MEKRKFCCMVEEGTRSGIVTVCLAGAEVDRLGDDAVIASVKRKWRQMTGTSLGTSMGMKEDDVQVLLIEEIAEPTKRIDPVLRPHTAPLYFKLQDLRLASRMED